MRQCSRRKWLSSSRYITTNAHATKEIAIDLLLKSCRILKSLREPRHHGDSEDCDGWEGVSQELGWSWIPQWT